MGKSGRYWIFNNPVLLIVQVACESMYDVNNRFHLASTLVNQIITTRTIRESRCNPVRGGPHPPTVYRTTFILLGKIRNPFTTRISLQLVCTRILRLERLGAIMQPIILWFQKSYGHNLNSIVCLG